MDIDIIYGGKYTFSKTLESKSTNDEHLCFEIVSPLMILEIFMLKETELPSLYFQSIRAYPKIILL